MPNYKKIRRMRERSDPLSSRSSPVVVRTRLGTQQHDSHRLLPLLCKMAPEPVLRSVAPEPVLALPGPGGGDDEVVKTRGRRNRKVHHHEDSTAREIRVSEMGREKQREDRARGTRFITENDDERACARVT